VQGCGGSSDSTSLASQSARGGPLSRVGALTASGSEGRVVSAAYRLGPLLYSKEGSPPQAVLKACGVDPSALANTVFSRGEITATFVEGPTIADFRFSPHESVDGQSYRGVTAFDVSGNWLCGGEFETILKRGAPKSFRFWIVSEVLSDAEPEVSKANLNTWHFVLIPVLAHPTFRATGAGAANCDYRGDDDMLMLYARPHCSASQ
jgi:hypothetical protein